MKHILLSTIFFCLFLSTSCKELEDIGKSDDNNKECTQVGTLTSINLRINANNIPTNFSVVLNGSDIYADECANNSNPFRNNIRVSDSRTQGNAILFLNTNQYVLNYYFPNGINNPPQAQYMNVRFYTRASCNDNPVKIAEANNVFLNWQPLQANGKDCGTTSYSANAEVSL